MAKILVTGGAGFIGSHLVDALVGHGHQVMVIDDLSVGLRSNLNKQAKFVKTSILSDQTSALIKRHRFNYIYHCAAQKNLQYSKKYPLDDAQTNILGSLKIIEAAKCSKITKIIFYSTAAVYEPEQEQPVSEDDTINPVTPYGIGKLTTEFYLMQSGLRYTILRLSNVYGPRQDAKGEGGVVSIFCSLIKKGQRPMIFNKGNHTRDFIYVGDVVNSSILAMKKGDFEIINISTGRQTSVLNLFKMISLAFGGSLRPRFGKTIEEQAFSALTNKKAARILNWLPEMQLSRGIVNTCHNL